MHCEVWGREKGGMSLCGCVFGWLITDYLSCCFAGREIMGRTLSFFTSIVFDLIRNYLDISQISPLLKMPINYDTPRFPRGRPSTPGLSSLLSSTIASVRCCCPYASSFGRTATFHTATSALSIPSCCCCSSGGSCSLRGTLSTLWSLPYSDYDNNVT